MLPISENIALNTPSRAKKNSIIHEALNLQVCLNMAKPNKNNQKRFTMLATEGGGSSRHSLPNQTTTGPGGGGDSLQKKGQAHVSGQIIKSLKSHKLEVRNVQDTFFIAWLAFHAVCETITLLNPSGLCARPVVPQRREGSAHTQSAETGRQRSHGEMMRDDKTKSPAAACQAAETIFLLAVPECITKNGCARL